MREKHSQKKEKSAQGTQDRKQRGEFEDLKHHCGWSTENKGKSGEAGRSQGSVVCLRVFALYLKNWEKPLKGLNKSHKYFSVLKRSVWLHHGEWIIREPV